MINLLPFIKGTCQSHIHSFYSTEKQTCINELQGYTKQEKDTMWNFINACRQRSNELEALYLADNLVVANIVYSDIVPEV